MSCRMDKYGPCSHCMDNKKLKTITSLGDKTKRSTDLQGQGDDGRAC